MKLSNIYNKRKEIFNEIKSYSIIFFPVVLFPLVIFLFFTIYDLSNLNVIRYYMQKESYNKALEIIELSLKEDSQFFELIQKGAESEYYMREKNYTFPLKYWHTMIQKDPLDLQKRIFLKKMIQKNMNTKGFLSLLCNADRINMNINIFQREIESGITKGMPWYFDDKICLRNFFYTESKMFKQYIFMTTNETQLNNIQNKQNSSLKKGTRLIYRYNDKNDMAFVFTENGLNGIVSIQSITPVSSYNSGKNVREAPLDPSALPISHP